jgi:hypothetical protein
MFFPLKKVGFGLQDDILLGYIVRSVVLMLPNSWQELGGCFGQGFFKKNMCKSVFLKASVNLL